MGGGLSRTEDLSRQNLSTVLRGLSDTTQKRVADQASVSETWLSRAKDDDGDIAKLCRVLAACDLVISPRNFALVHPEKLQALRVLAREAINAETRASEWGVP
jgi:hypothetical protein